MALKSAQNVCQRCKYKWEFQYEAGPDLSDWRSAGIRRLLDGNDVVLYEDHKPRLNLICDAAIKAGYRIRPVVSNEESANELEKQFAITTKSQDLHNFVLSESFPHLLRSLRIRSTEYSKALVWKEGTEFWLSYPWDEWELCEVLLAANQSGRVSKIIFVGNERLIRQFGDLIEAGLSRQEDKDLVSRVSPQVSPCSRHSSEFKLSRLYGNYEGLRPSRFKIFGDDWIRDFGELADAALWEECKLRGKPFFSQTPESLQPVCSKCSSQWWSVEDYALFAERFAGRFWEDQLSKLYSYQQELRGHRPQGLARGQITVNSVVRWCLDFLFEVFKIPRLRHKHHRNEADLFEFMLENIEAKSTNTGVVPLGTTKSTRRMQEWTQSWKEFQRHDVVLYRWQQKELETTTDLWNSSCETLITKSTVLRLYLEIPLNVCEPVFREWIKHKFEPAPENPWIRSQRSGWSTAFSTT